MSTLHLSRGARLASVAVLAMLAAAPALAQERAITIVLP